MWRWRDWVIDAFNRNQPFDQFTIEQLAGDLLPESHARAADRHRLQPQPSHERRRRQHSPRNGASKGVIDRVETTSAVWMALTMGCARCHDHKYDPLTQKEFYQFFAFFNNVPENGHGRRHRPRRRSFAPREPEDDMQLAELDTGDRRRRKRGSRDRSPSRRSRRPSGSASRARSLLEQAKSWRVLTPQATSAGGATFAAASRRLVSGQRAAAGHRTFTR